MKTQDNLIGRTIDMKHSKWVLTVLVALALLVAVLGMTGCNDPDNSGGHSHHGIRTPLTGGEL